MTYLNNNYRSLVSETEYKPNIKLDQSILHAIYIPFTKRPDYINKVLADLSWYSGPIYLMPSEQADIVGLFALSKNITILDSYNQIKSIISFESNNHVFTKANDDKWDLPHKRNYTVYHGLLNGYTNILIVDDDIRGLGKEKVLFGASALQTFDVVGCYVDNYPDTSQIGYIELSCGISIEPFLSGSFLFIKLSDKTAFFPNIYNEDWLFMVPSILNSSICSYGTISQELNNPFSDLERASFQEFGEVIAEGCFSLLHNNMYSQIYNRDTWHDIICERNNELTILLSQNISNEQTVLVKSAMAVNKTITPYDCINYIISLDSDCKRWKSLLKEVCNGQ